MVITQNIKNLMRMYAYDLVSELVYEEIPFRLIIWNNNNWDKELPENIKKDFKEQLVLDIRGATLESSYIDESNGNVVINTAFGDEPYEKIIYPEEIVGILTLDGAPLVINSFPQEDEPEIHFTLEKEDDEMSKQDIIETLEHYGFSKEESEASLKAFLPKKDEI